MLLLCVAAFSSDGLEEQGPKKRSGLEMVFVRGGNFTMGGNDGSHTGRGLDECPHQVEVGDFSIGKYEVTQADWIDLMGTNPSHFKDCRDCPVEQVSWEDAMTFIQKANRRYKENFRLPIEAEWEFAARGGMESQGYRYAGSNHANEVSWWGSNSKERSHPVGSLKPNELGIYDMSGNIREWCADLKQPYPCDTAGNKFDARVLRGGTWSLDSSNLRVRDRNGRGQQLRLPALGFRLAK